MAVEFNLEDLIGTEVVFLETFMGAPGADGTGGGLSTEQVQDIVGALITGTSAHITSTYDDSSGNLSLDFFDPLDLRDLSEVQLDNYSIRNAGSPTDIVETRSRSIDDVLYPRYGRRADGRTIVQNPNGPLDWGLHGDTFGRGTGSDFDHYIEHSGATAHTLVISFSRIRATDGNGNYCRITFPPAWPLDGTTGHDTVQVNDTTDFANADTLTVAQGAPEAGVFRRTGTITYTSKDATHFYGCTSTGMAVPSDITQIDAFWVTDTYGAPIARMMNYLGFWVNDQIVFRAAGVFTDSDQDIEIGFDNAATRTGNAIKFGHDGNVKIFRDDDGFGNNQWKVYADNTVWTWSTAGFYPSVVKNIGTILSPHGSGYINKILSGDGTVTDPAIRYRGEATGPYLAAAGDVRQSVGGVDALRIQGDAVSIPTASTLNLGFDDLVTIGRANDGFGNNIEVFTSDSGILRWQLAGLYPSSSSRQLGTSLSRWGKAWITGLDANGAAIENVLDPTGAQHAATLAFVERRAKIAQFASMATTGRYSTVGGNVTTGALTTGVEMAIPIMFPVVPGNPTALAVWVNTGVGSSLVRLGIRADAGGANPAPSSTVLVDGGTVATTSSGVLVSVSISGWTPVPWTLYWLTCTSQGASASNLVKTNAVQYTLTYGSADLVSIIGGYVQTGVTGALPSSWPALAGTANPARVGVLF